MWNKSRGAIWVGVCLLVVLLFCTMRSERQKVATAPGARLQSVPSIAAVAFQGEPYSGVRVEVGLASFVVPVDLLDSVTRIGQEKQDVQFHFLNPELVLKVSPPEQMSDRSNLARLRYPSLPAFLTQDEVLFRAFICSLPSDVEPCMSTGARVEWEQARSTLCSTIAKPAEREIIYNGCIKGLIDYSVHEDGQVFSFLYFSPDEQIVGWGRGALANEDGRMMCRSILGTFVLSDRATNGAAGLSDDAFEELRKHARRGGGVSSQVGE